VRDARDLEREGTFAPFLRASLSPMAIACFWLVTVRPDPDRSVPRFRRRWALSTLFDADFEYRFDSAMFDLVAGAFGRP
jgi:hypothetical protein